MENAIHLDMFGRVNIDAQPDEGYRTGIRRTTGRVTKTGTS